MPSQRAFGVLIVGLTLWSLALGQRPAEFASHDEANVYIKTYYQSPKPERIGPLIRSLGTVYKMTSPSAPEDMAAFLSEVFRSNPKEVETWQQIAAKDNPQVLPIITEAIALSKQPEGVLNRREVSAATNDMYWGAFFASGNRKYLDRLISELSLYDLARYPHHSTTSIFDSKEDFNSFMAGGTAAWSLSANLDQSAVREAVTEAAAHATGRQAEVLHEVLTSNPNDIKAGIKAKLGKGPT